MTKAAKKPQAAMFEQLRRETARMLGYPLDSLSPGQSLRLDRAVGLKLELDQLQSQQIAGNNIDIRRLVEITTALEELLPPVRETTDYDLSLLSDEELRTALRLLSKASGQPSEADADLVCEAHTLEQRIQQLTEENVALRDEVARLTEIAPPGYLQSYAAGLADQLRRERTEVTRLTKALEIGTRDRGANTVAVSEPPEPNASSAKAVEPIITVQAPAPSNVHPINDFRSGAREGLKPTTRPTSAFKTSNDEGHHDETSRTFPESSDFAASRLQAQLRNRP